MVRYYLFGLLLTTVTAGLCTGASLGKSLELYPELIRCDMLMVDRDTTGHAVPQDTLRLIGRTDSLINESTAAIQSIRHEYEKVFDKTQQYVQALRGTTDTLQLGIASKTGIGLKRDSATQQLRRLQENMESKIDSVKERCYEQLDKLPKTPETQAALAGVRHRLELLKPTEGPIDKAGSIINVPDGSQLPLASGAPLDKLPSVPGLEPGGVGDQAAFQNIAQRSAQAKSLANSSVDEIVDSNASRVSSLDEVQRANVPEISSLKNEDSMRQELMQKGAKEAVSRFAGKESELRASMDKLTKLKAKYSDINSLKELKERARNPLAGKPFRDRAIPGIQMQVGVKNDNIVVDFNPYLNYRMWTSVNLGGGWNQRFVYSYDARNFHAAERIFGPRLFGEYKLSKGFSPKLEVEVMNTKIPPYLQVGDARQRAWIPGLFTGIKKEYKFFGNTKGTTSIMARIFNFEKKSPYGDIVNIRFGFEFPLKRAKKAPDTHERH